MPREPEPLVSIIIPCFLSTPHQGTLLTETLETVARQTYRNFEVVLVDDGSNIDPMTFATECPNVRIYRQENAGSAVARNTGIAASRGEVFVFLDADDYLLPPALEAGLAVLREHPECEFALGKREEMTYEGAPVPWGVASLPRETQLYRTLLAFDWYIIPPSSAMFRRSIVERVGGFRNPWGADDLDFYLRVANQSLGWCHEEPAVTRYRRYSTSSSRDGERMLKSIREVYARQRPVVQGNAELEAAWQQGLARLVEIFRDCVAENLRDRVQAKQWSRALRAAGLLLRESPGRLWQEGERWLARRRVEEGASLGTREVDAAQ